VNFFFFFFFFFFRQVKTFFYNSHPINDIYLNYMPSNAIVLSQYIDVAPFDIELGVADNVKNDAHRCLQILMNTYILILHTFCDN
jgi:hypothetical protein